MAGFDELSRKSFPEESTQPEPILDLRPWAAALLYFRKRVEERPRRTRHELFMLRLLPRIKYLRELRGGESVSPNGLNHQVICSFSIKRPLLWTSGWRTPGGDYDENMVAKAQIQLARGAGPITVDVTRAMKEILESGEPWNGIIVTTDPHEGIGIDSDDVSRFSNLSNATVDVSWRKVPPKPRELQTDAPGGE